MSDANKYMNAYVDNAVGTLHEYLGLILQLKTQLRLVNDSIQEKDAVINNLTSDLSNSQQINTEVVGLREQARIWEDSYNAMKNKVAHLDTALAQVSEMKKEIISLNATIESLNNEIVALKTKPKSKINTKKATVDTVEVKNEDNILGMITEEIGKSDNTVDDF